MRKGQFGYHIGRAKEMLAELNPTEDELRRLPTEYLRLYAIERDDGADAESAIIEIRRQKARAEILANNREESRQRRAESRAEVKQETDGPAPWEPINPHSPSDDPERDEKMKRWAAIRRKEIVGAPISDGDRAFYEEHGGMEGYR